MPEGKFTAGFGPGQSLNRITNRHHKIPHDENAELRDAARARISRRLTQIREVVNTATATLSCDYNVFLPLYRLPDELFVEIFRLLTVEDLMRVTLVSKRLRSVALSASKLWSTINVPSVPANHARLLVQRSGKTELKVCVKQVGQGRRRLGFGRLVPIPRPPPWGVDEFIGVVDRIEYLDGMVGPTSYLNYETLSLRMPRLRTLVLRGSPRHPDQAETTEVPHPLFAGSPSLVRVIFLDTIHPSWSDPVFADLSHLCIRHPETRPTFMELGVVLSSCPNLQSLELFNVFVSPTPSDPTLSLPSLKWLHVTDVISTIITSFFERIQLPRDANVKVHGPDYDALAAFWNPNTPTLDGLSGMTSLHTHLLLPSHVTIGGVSPSGAFFSYYVGPDDTDPPWEFQIDPEPTTDFFTAADKSPIPWKNIENLHISGYIGDSVFCEELLYRCSKIRELFIPICTPQNPELVLRALGPWLCPKLERLSIQHLPADQAQSLIDFLEGRRSGGYTCAVVYLRIGRLEGQVADSVLDRMKKAVEYLVISDGVILGGTEMAHDETTVDPGAFFSTASGIPCWDDTFYYLDAVFPYDIR